MTRGGAAIEQGNAYHLISRFVAKEWFIESALERRMYLSLLGTAIQETDWELFCFAVMSSHIHLGVIAGSTPLALWMRPMHTAFANWMNTQRQRIGAVFVKGPNVIDVPPDDGARLIEYVHRNPVRAGIVKHPAETDWTSHRAYLGMGHLPSWLEVERGLSLAGFASRDDFALWSDRNDADDPDAARRFSARRSRGRPRKAEPSGTQVQIKISL